MKVDFYTEMSYTDTNGCPWEVIANGMLQKVVAFIFKHT